MELQQLCLGSQGTSVHILGNTLFSNYKIKAFGLILKLNTEDSNSAEQELCTEHIGAPGQHRDGASGEMSWPASTAHGHPLPHGSKLDWQDPNQDQARQGWFSWHGEGLLWEPGLQCWHFWVCWAWSSPVPADGRVPVALSMHRIIPWCSEGQWWCLNNEVPEQCG